MSKYLIILLFILLVLNQGKAQRVDFSLSSEKNSYTSKVLRSKFKNFKTFSLDTHRLKTLLSANKNVATTFDLYILDYQWQLTLTSANIAPTGSPQIIDQRLSLITYDPSYMGATQEGKNCRLTINDDFIAGFLPLGNQEFYIEPIYHIDEDAPKNTFIIYEKSQIIPDRALRCLATDVAEQQPLKTAAVRSLVACAEVELAIATDYSMFVKYGSVSAVQNRVISVMNLVGPLYKGVFATDIEFKIITWYNISVSGGDPWIASTSASSVLSSFSTWGTNGGFAGNYDLGQFWTARDFDGGTIGIAWLSGVCVGNKKFHAIQDFSTNDAYMRCLVAHEIGHNFSMSHNSAIMAPNVSEATTWSSTSISQMNTYIPTVTNNACLTPCTSTGGGGNSSFAAIAGFDFALTESTTCINRQVGFDNFSTNNPTSYKWVFENGTPATSTLASPKVIFKTAGTYRVSLTASNPYGSSTVNKTITVTNAPTTAFTYKVKNFDVELSNTTPEDASWLWKTGDGKTYTTKNVTHTYAKNGTFNVVLTATNACGTKAASKLVPVFANSPVAQFSLSQSVGCIPLQITANNNSINASTYKWIAPGAIISNDTIKNPSFSFLKAGKYSITLIAYNSNLSDTITLNQAITVKDKPSIKFLVDVGDNGYIALENQTINADSLFWNFGDGNISNDSLPAHFYNKSGKYIITLQTFNDCGVSNYIDSVDILLYPIADFKTDSIYTSCKSVTVNINDNFSIDAEYYTWYAPRATRDSAFAKNPTFTYNTSGYYVIFLAVQNKAGFDTISKNFYINIMPDPRPMFKDSAFQKTVFFENNSVDANHFWWNFGDNTGLDTTRHPIHTYQIDGTYEVSLTALNECDTITIRKTITIISIPIADFAVSTDSKCIPIQATFTTLSSNSIASYEWTFDGGTPNKSNDANPKVSYQKAGNYSVKLVVKNSAGADSITKQDIIKINSTPTTNFDYSIDKLTITLSQKSINADTYLWKFGDGMTSTEPSPTHTYAKNGTYKITLEATNECGTDLYSKNVVIQPIHTTELTSKPLFELYPNPTNDILYIKNLNSDNIYPLTLIITNMLGQRLFLENNITINANENYQIGLTHLPKGSYVVELIQKKKVQRSIILIQ